jgi:SAM-dependent methyltransferase
LNSNPLELAEQANQICRRPEFQRMLLRYCAHPSELVQAPRLNTEIHPRDQMLLHSLQHHRDADVALSQYFAISLQQHAAAMQIYRCFFDQGDTATQWLDFACGYGRLLRLLSLSLLPEQMWASEIQPDAIAFVQDAFSVRAIPSHLDPEQFQPGRRFDFIWVASLFSHLPDALFRDWMRCLTSLLTPRGVLCFSVRSSDLLAAEADLPASGLRYDRSSELTDLDADVYGTAYASEDYVRDVIAAALGQAHPYRRLRRALAQEQDLYVVCADASVQLAALDGFRRGPWGWLDRRKLDRDGTLHLEGWAASLDDGPVAAIEIRIDDALHECTTSVPRSDVVEALGDTRLLNSGWSFRTTIENPSEPYRIEVSARSAQGELAFIFAGTLSATAES